MNDTLTTAINFVDDFELKRIEKALTKREVEIFNMLGNGKTVTEIAKELYICRRTAESHRDHIKRKLEIPNVLKLYQLAYRWSHTAFKS